MLTFEVNVLFEPFFKVNRSMILHCCDVLPQSVIQRVLKPNGERETISIHH